jgi:hypothetical protein
VAVVPETAAVVLGVAAVVLGVSSLEHAASRVEIPAALKPRTAAERRKSLRLRFPAR